MLCDGLCSTGNVKQVKETVSVVIIYCELQHGKDALNLKSNTTFSCEIWLGAARENDFSE